jgi:hypothetical protein
LLSIHHTAIRRVIVACAVDRGAPGNAMNGLRH